MHGKELRVLKTCHVAAPGLLVDLQRVRNSTYQHFDPSYLDSLIRDLQHILT
jgi:hypothetical protein